MSPDSSTNATGTPFAKTKTPDPVDIYVGERIRNRRKMLALTQSDLASMLSISSQQIQKYERGENRIGASRLLYAARALEVPVGYFFNGAEEKLLGDHGHLTTVDHLNHEETPELLELYFAISNSVLRKKVLELARMFITNAQENEAEP